MAFAQNIQVIVNREDGIQGNGCRHSQLLQDCVLDLHHPEMKLEAPMKDLEEKEVEAKNDLETFKYEVQRGQVSL